MLGTAKRTFWWFDKSLIWMIPGCVFPCNLSRPFLPKTHSILICFSIQMSRVFHPWFHDIFISCGGLCSAGSRAWIPIICYFSLLPLSSLTHMECFLWQIKTTGTGASSTSLLSPTLVVSGSSWSKGKCVDFEPEAPSWSLSGVTLEPSDCD